MEHWPVLPESMPQASRSVSNLKPTLQAEVQGQANRPFSQKDWGVCQSTV